MENKDQNLYVTTDVKKAKLKIRQNGVWVQYAPVIYAKWEIENEASIRCTNCYFNRASIKMPLDYCPVCGAKMVDKDNPLRQETK